MGNARDLKVDWLRGGKCSFPLGLAASVQIYPRSGKFVYTSGGYGTHAAAAATFLIGWVEVGLWDYTNGAKAAYFLAAGTAGATIVNCIRDLTAVFRMPLLYTASIANYAVTKNGGYCDLVASTTAIQLADLTTATRNVLIVVGGLEATAVNTSATFGDGYVDVMMNPATTIGG